MDLREIMTPYTKGCFDHGDVKTRGLFDLGDVATRDIANRGCFD